MYLFLPGASWRLQGLFTSPITSLPFFQAGSNFASTSFLKPLWVFSLFDSRQLHVPKATPLIFKKSYGLSMGTWDDSDICKIIPLSFLVFFFILGEIY